MKIESLLMLFAVLLFSWWLGGSIVDGYHRGNQAFVHVYNSISRDLSGEGYVRK